MSKNKNNSYFERTAKVARETSKFNAIFRACEKGIKREKLLEKDDLGAVSRIKAVIAWGLRSGQMTEKDGKLYAKPVASVEPEIVYEEAA